MFFGKYLNDAPPSQQRQLKAQRADGEKQSRLFYQSSNKCLRKWLRLKRLGWGFSPSGQYNCVIDLFPSYSNTSKQEGSSSYVTPPPWSPSTIYSLTQTGEIVATFSSDLCRQLAQSHNQKSEFFLKFIFNSYQEKRTVTFLVLKIEKHELRVSSSCDSNV